MCVVLCVFVCVCLFVSVHACVHKVKIYHRSGTFNCVLCVCARSQGIPQECTFNSHSSLTI